MQTTTIIIFAVNQVVHYGNIAGYIWSMGKGSWKTNLDSYGQLTRSLKKKKAEIFLRQFSMISIGVGIHLSSRQLTYDQVDKKFTEEDALAVILATC